MLNGKAFSNLSHAKLVVMPEVKRDAMAGLTSVELGKVLGIDEEEVLQRELAGKLFSYRGERGKRVYPAFQAWQGVVGKPLQTVLAALRDAGSPGGSAAHVFFAVTTDMLGNLTPVEALIGKSLITRPFDPAVPSFLASPAEERLESVVAAAKAHAGSAGA